MTLTEAQDSTIYEVTMETINSTFEEVTFQNVSQTRSGDEAFEGTQSAKVGPESIGPAKMLVVTAGDEVDLKVYAKYASSFTSTTSGNSSNIGAALASLFGATGGGATTYELNNYNLLNSNSGVFLASIDDTGTSTVPKAYLNYLFFDQDFSLITGKSGYQKVDNGASGAFDILEVNNLTFDEGGYLYVYVSSQEGIINDF